MSHTRGGQRGEATVRLEPDVGVETPGQILRILRRDRGTVSVERLAERIAATAPGEGAIDDVDALGVRLYHVHLPELADRDLVDWDPQERTVSIDDRSATDAESSGADRSSDADTDGAASSGWSVAGERRREVLRVVEWADGSITRPSLAHVLAMRAADGLPSAGLVDDIELRLHHYLLPKLESAGLVEYDPADDLVERPGATESAPPVLGVSRGS